jgi:hypothetical protein
LPPQAIKAHSAWQRLITGETQEVLTPLVEGKTVYDLGAGDLR